MADLIVSLLHIPDNFATNYLQDSRLSSRSRRQGLKFHVEGYIHCVKLIRKSEQLITIDAKCYHSMRKSEKPNALFLDVSTIGQGIENCLCSCTAG